MGIVGVEFVTGFYADGEVFGYVSHLWEICVTFPIGR